ncbi:MAG: hypothetical protein WBG90_22135 [Saonia sp.]
MDFNEILKELKDAILKISEEQYGELTEESKKDIEDFLKTSKEKLLRWTVLLANNELSKEDYEWLVKSQKDLLEMQGLLRVGVSKISLGHFKNKVVKTIVDIVTGIVF